MKHMMIDIETLDTATTAVVPQVGWCLFDENGSLVNPREIDASEGLKAIKNRYMTEQQITRAEFLKEVKCRGIQSTRG